MSTADQNETLRHRLWTSRPVAAVRERLIVEVRPVGRRLLSTDGNPGSLLRGARIAVPGGSHQIPEEIGGFIEFVRPREPVRVCEIGTAAGGTTLLLSHLAPSVQTMIGVDVSIQNGRVVKALAPAGQRLELVEASSLDQDTVERVRRILAGEPLDVLFIDGSHHYEDVRHDFLSYRELVRPGGLIAFHDIVQDHGARFRRQTPHWAGGVPQLWSELRGIYPSHEFVHDPEQDAFGIGVLEWTPEGKYP